MSKENLFPIFKDQKVTRQDRENRLKQRSRVLWFCGLSGSGKSTLAIALEHELHQRGFLCYVLDGDNIRTGLNSNLGFSDEDRTENLRRIAEVARLFAHAGVVTIASFITPLESQRQQSRSIIGEENYLEIFVDCPFEVCEQRDVKGLYARAKAGKVAQFTGRGSQFEPPVNPHLRVDTASESLEESLAKIVEFILPHISPQDGAAR